MIAQGLSVTYYFSDLPFIGVFGPRYLSIIKPVSEFYADAAAGRLPNLAFVDPMFLDGGGGRGLSGDEHPHGDIRIGQAFMADIVHSFVSSPQFRTGAMFITTTSGVASSTTFRRSSSPMTSRALTWRTTSGSRGSASRGGGDLALRPVVGTSAT